MLQWWGITPGEWYQLGHQERLFISHHWMEMQERRSEGDTKEGGGINGDVMSKLPSDLRQEVQGYL